MKITEAMRRKMAWEMIDSITANAETTSPELWAKESAEAVNACYRVAHSILSPKCRKNHPGWVEAIDAAIKAKGEKR